MKKSIIVVAALIPLVLIGAAAVWQLGGTDDRRIGAIDSTSDPVGLSWRGAWDPDAQYTPGEVVSLEGSSYVAESEVTGTSPVSVRWCSGRIAEDCPWARLSKPSAPPNVVKTAKLDLNNPSTTLYDIPGVGQILAFCDLTSTEAAFLQDADVNSDVTWRYKNTTSENRVLSTLGTGSTAFPSKIIPPGQNSGEGGSNWFANRVVVFPLAGTAPYADVFVSGTVIWSGPPSDTGGQHGSPTSCEIKAIAQTG